MIRLSLQEDSVHMQLDDAPDYLKLSTVALIDLIQNNCSLKKNEQVPFTFHQPYFAIVSAFDLLLCPLASSKASSVSAACIASELM